MGSHKSNKAKPSRNTQNNTSNLWQLEQLEPKILLSADLMPGVQEIQGNITQPGEQDSYEFVVTQNSKLFFDGVAGSNINWSLYDANNNSYFSSKDLTSNSDKLVSLTTGKYKLQVDGNGQTTGDYKFRLLAEESATVLTANQPTTGTLSPTTQAQLYKIPVSQGDRLYVQINQLNNQAKWTLFDNAGNIVTNAANFSQDLNNVVANADGNYWLSVEGTAIQENTSYNLTVYQQKQATTPMIGLNQPNTLTLIPGSSNSYVFNIDQAGLTGVDFQSLLDSGIAWSVVNQDTGLSVLNSSNNQYLAELAQGHYQLTITNNGRYTGDIGFELLTANATSEKHTLPYTLDYQTSDSFKANLQSIHVDSNGTYVLAKQQASDNFNYTIYDSQYRLVSKGNLANSITPINLTEGDYFIWLDSQNSLPDNQSHQVTLVKQQQTTQNLGSLNSHSLQVTTNFTYAGEVMTYQFSVDEPVVADLSALSGQGIQVSLTSDEGQLLNNISLEQMQTQFANLRYLKPGNYTLTLTNQQTATNQSQMRIQTLAQSVSANLAVDKPVDLSSLSVGASQVYQLTATPADSFSLSLQEDLSHFEIVVVDAYGQDKYLEIDANTANQYLFSSQTATSDLYVILRRIVPAETGAVSTLTLGQTSVPVEVKPSTPIALNTPQVIDFAGQTLPQSSYQFELTESGSIELQFNMAQGGNPWISLEGPGGELFNRTIYSYDQTHQVLTLATWAPKGAYQLFFNHIADTKSLDFVVSSTPFEPTTTVQNYTQALGNLSTAAPTTWSHDFNSSTQTADIAFSVDQDMDWVFDANSNRQWRVVNETGDTIYTGQSGDIVHLTMGNYHLMVNAYDVALDQPPSANQQADATTILFVPTSLATSINLDTAVLLAQPEPSLFVLENIENNLYQVIINGTTLSRDFITNAINNGDSFVKIIENKTYIYFKSGDIILRNEDWMPINEAKATANFTVKLAPAEYMEGWDLQTHKLDIGQSATLPTGRGYYEIKAAAQTGLIFFEPTSIQERKGLNTWVIAGQGEKNSGYYISNFIQSPFLALANKNSLLDISNYSETGQPIEFNILDLFPNLLSNNKIERHLQKN